VDFPLIPVILFLRLKDFPVFRRFRTEKKIMEIFPFEQQWLSRVSHLLAVLENSRRPITKLIFADFAQPPPAEANAALSCGEYRLSSNPFATIPILPFAVLLFFRQMGRVPKSR
jgi:hypothetical protein